MIIAPGEGETATALASAAREAGWTVRLAKRAGAGERQGLGESGSPARATSPSGEGLPPWNPASYISAGALALAASSHAPIDALVLLAEPEKAEFSLFDGPPGSLAEALEAATAGPIWLSREAIRRFEARKEGKCLLIAKESLPAQTMSPGESAWQTFVVSAFKGFGEGLFDRSRGAPWKAWGIVDKSPKPQALAAFAIALLEEGKETKAGRWLPFNGKGGIFGIF